MSATRKKKKSAEQVPDFDALLAQSREEAKAEEERLKAERSKLAERNLAEENFLKKEKGGLRHYNQRRQMHFDVEQVKEREIIEEKW